MFPLMANQPSQASHMQFTHPFLLTHFFWDQLLCLTRCLDPLHSLLTDRPYPRPHLTSLAVTTHPHHYSPSFSISTLALLFRPPMWHLGPMPYAWRGNIPNPII